jgi:hypothetical protein
MRSGQPLLSCRCGNLHVLGLVSEESSRRTGHPRSPPSSFSDGELTDLAGYEIGHRSIVVHDAATVHTITLSYGLYQLTCKTCHWRIQLAVSQSRGFVQEHATQPEQECPTSLLTQIPIQLRGFLDFNPTFTPRVTSEKEARDGIFDVEATDEWDANSRAIVGSFEESSLMDFAFWEPSSMPLANSVP